MATDPGNILYVEPDYGIKYDIGFETVLGQRYKVNLKKNEYNSPIVHHILGAESPVVVTDPNKGGSISVPIKGMKTQINSIVKSNNTEYNFIQDFSNIYEREWKAELIRIKENNAYKGSCSINILDLDNTTIPAVGSLTITNFGTGLMFAPSCKMQLSIYAYPNLSTTLNLYAVPAHEDNQYLGRLLIRSIPVYYTDTTLSVINRICEDPDFIVVNSTPPYIFKYTQRTYNEYISSGWNIKPEYLEEINAYGTTNDYRFTGATQREWLDVRFRIKRFGEDPESIFLARHYWETGESLHSIAVDIALQIAEHSIISNVYFPMEDVYKTMRIVAVPYTSGKINIYLYDIGETGNGIQITDSELDDTYFQIVKSSKSSYAWTTSDCAGGVHQGDTFTIQLNTNNQGYENFVQVEAENNDTKELLISKLNKKIFQEKINWTAWIDDVDTCKLWIKTEIESNATFRFITSGSSAVQDTGPNFMLSAAYNIESLSWVVPGLMQFPRQNGYIPISLDTISGLGDLRNQFFSGMVYMPYNKVSYMDIIVYILKKTGFNLRIYEAFDLWEYNMDMNISPLKQMYIDTSLLDEKDCYTILSEIAFSLDATVKQEEGAWRFVPLNQLTGVVTYRVFDYSGMYMGKTVVDYRINMDASDGNPIYINADAIQSYQQPYSKIIFTQDYGFVPQLIKYPLFNNFNFIQEDFNLSYPWKWVIDDISQTSFLGKLYRNEAGILTIQDASGQETAFELTQRFTISRINKADADKSQYNLIIEYECQAENVDAAGTLKFQLEMLDGYDSFLGTTGYWTRAIPPPVISIPVKDSTGIKKGEFPFGYNPFSGQENDEVDLVIRIRQPEEGEGYISIKSIKVEVNTAAASAKKQAMYFIDEDITGNQYYQKLLTNKLEKKMEIGDAPNIPNAKYIYKNALLKFTANNFIALTSSWKTLAGEIKKPLLSYIQERLLKREGVYATKIQASIRGNMNLSNIIWDYYGVTLFNLLDFDEKNVLTSGQRQVILHPTQPAMKMILTGGSWDIRHSTIQGEWVQLNLEDTQSNFPQKIKVELLPTEETSGSDAYTGNTGGAGTIAGLTEEQVLQMLLGYVGSFTGGDLNSSRQITIIHNLQRSSVLFLLYKEGEYVPSLNYKLTNNNTNTQITITLSVPYSSMTEFKYRII